MKRYERRMDAPYTFWQYELLGTILVTQFAELGRLGRKNEKTYPDAAKANAAAAAAVHKREADGYVQVENL